MAIARLLLPLLILAGLALFALQNWSLALPLVIAGFRTQALPLAIWMLVAIGAGAATTVAVSSLFSLTRISAVRRSNKGRQPANAYAPAADKKESRPGASSWANRVQPGAGAATQSARTGTQTRIQDDWENRKIREEWDDWDEDVPQRSPGRGADVNIRDRQDEDWDNWEGYPDGPQRPRTQFEANQSPTAQRQSGSVYSQSYDKSDQSRDADRPNSVYDADYRVIIPPTEPAKAPELDDEDWGFEDEDIPDEPSDRPRRN
jgi:hypothetical protein